jgi:hypothetical protein
MKYFTTLVFSFLLSNTAYAINFYHGHWEAEKGGSCSDITGKVILGYKENSEFNFAMFCKFANKERVCEKSGSKNSRLSMAHGEIGELSKLEVKKHEGFKPSGTLSGAKASGTFQSTTGCKGSWTAIN